MTLRLLQSELTKDGSIDLQILNQLCTVFEGAYSQAKASRRRPSTIEQQLFTTQELEWFSKNSYNFALKHCAEIPPRNLAKLVNVCAEVIDNYVVDEKLLMSYTVHQALKAARERAS